MANWTTSDIPSRSNLIAISRRRLSLAALGALVLSATVPKGAIAQVNPKPS